ncbi:MAG TPA: carboxypeptidase regulatory-like domain-containing protein [Pyrinomonadaceae bacterium]|nr:carboxypeptidase regulatory-like domain-containing protein [Pyrinomonadaceae bacterium]
MKKKVLVGTMLLAAMSVFVLAMAFWFNGSDLIAENESEENDMYDGPDIAFQFEYDRTKDPATGVVPDKQLLVAIDKTMESKEADARARGIQLPTEEIGHRLLKDDTKEEKTDRTGRRSAKTAKIAPDAPSALVWTERGPNSDTVGPSNGNTRANGGITSGRIRSILVDANDSTGKTVLVGGVDGGLWKTTDITLSPATWTQLSENLSNLAVSDIVQDPRPGQTNTLYFGTGEGYRNADAVRGNGIFKSLDGGATWTYLPSTSSFVYTTRLVIDSAGNLYAGTRISGGLYRSTDGGTTWTNITPAGLPSVDVCDIEISSTGRLHVTFGIIATNSYRFTDIPTTVDANTWTTATTVFTASPVRTEMAVSGNTLYAAPVDAGYQVPTLFKSTDGGANWAATGAQPTSGWASQQGWYSLSMGINPTDANQVIVGGLDTHKSNDGGATWTKISAWVGTGGQYVHADQHDIAWYDGGNKLLFASDGGIFYSADGGTTIRDRNVGLRLKQFYSVAMLPTAGSNYFLAGAQDNGTHALSLPGLGASVEVTGGDGAFVAIDQNEPQYLFGAYVYNQYRRSTNGGASWSSVNFSSTVGRFINPFDYENTANIMYCADAASSYRRWTNPQTGSTSAVVAVSNMAGNVTSVSVSPFTTNRVFFGTSSSQVVRVDAADTFVSGSAGVNITPAGASGTVSNLAVGTDDNNLMAIYSNYGVTNVWVSTNGGTTWTASDGNLPDMPVRWALFRPGDNTKAYIATETGVWETSLLNGASTVWTANSTFPAVRTDMIRYRPSDRTIAAGTHGRGVWTATVPLIDNVSVSGRVLTADGRGVRNAFVTISNAGGVVQQVRTGPLGAYRFDNIPVGVVYNVAVRSRRFTFAPRQTTPNDNLADFNFVAQ